MRRKIFSLTSFLQCLIKNKIQTADCEKRCVLVNMRCNFRRSSQLHASSAPALSSDATFTITSFVPMKCDRRLSALQVCHHVSCICDFHHANFSSQSLAREFFSNYHTSMSKKNARIIILLKTFVTTDSR
jgi:hypothetical protein